MRYSIDCRLCCCFFYTYHTYVWKLFVSTIDEIGGGWRYCQRFHFAGINHASQNVGHRWCFASLILVCSIRIQSIQKQFLFAVGDNHIFALQSFCCMIDIDHWSTSSRSSIKCTEFSCHHIRDGNCQIDLLFEYASPFVTGVMLGILTNKVCWRFSNFSQVPFIYTCVYHDIVYDSMSLWVLVVYKHVWCSMPSR